MSPRALQTIQNVLLTAVAVVLALVVWAAFLRIIRPPDASVVAANQAQFETTTSSPTPFPGASATTLPPDQGDGEEEPETARPPSSDVCREDPPATGSGTVLRIYYTCGPSTVPTAGTYVYRAIPDTDLVLTKTLEELVRGPDEDEQTRGFVSFFSDATRNAFRGVNIASGTAQVDFTGLGSIENLSSDTGGTFFIANLNANVFQFDTINAVQYSLDGSCDAFWGLFGSSCQVISRGDFERQVAEWRAQG
jgi:hypothetical protein